MIRHHDTAPVDGETIAEAATRIRTAIPIQLDTATEAECRARRDAIEDTLTARAVWRRERAWHSAQLGDGQIAGVWAHSTEEAELQLSVWWGKPCHWVIADPDLRVRAEYLPNGTHTAATAGRRFPLAPPRRPRDQYAAASPLFDLSATSTDAPTLS